MLTTVADLIARTAIVSGFTAADITGGRRNRALVDHRSAVAWLARHHLHRSYPQIAARLGQSNHTSAMHHVARAERLRAESPEFLALCDRIWGAPEIEDDGFVTVKPRELADA